MLFNHVTSTVLALVVTVAAAPNALSNEHNTITLDKRVPLIGEFLVYKERDCSGTFAQFVQAAFGTVCGVCTTFTNSTVMESINVTGLQPQCQLTLYTSFDCSDDGVVSGFGCWSPEGGIAAYTWTCPWWPADSQSPACGNP